MLCIWKYIGGALHMRSWFCSKNRLPFSSLLKFVRACNLLRSTTSSGVSFSSWSPGNVYPVDFFDIKLSVILWEKVQLGLLLSTYSTLLIFFFLPLNWCSTEGPLLSEVYDIWSVSVLRKIQVWSMSLPHLLCIWLRRHVSLDRIQPYFRF